MNDSGNTGPLGQPRGIGFGIILYIITLNFYSWYWVYKTQEEVKQHAGDGLGGVLGLVVWIIISPVSAFVIPSEIGRMYQKDGQHSPVTGWTGLWLFPFGDPHHPGDRLVREDAGRRSTRTGEPRCPQEQPRLRPKPDLLTPADGRQRGGSTPRASGTRHSGRGTAEDEVELLGVGLVVDEAVLEERKRRAVGRRELAEQVVAPGEQPLEELERAGELPAELVDPLRVRLRLSPARPRSRSEAVSRSG